MNRHTDRERDQDRQTYRQRQTHRQELRQSEKEKKRDPVIVDVCAPAEIYIVKFDSLQCSLESKD